VAPSVPELVDFFVRLEDDPGRRGLLSGSPFQIFEAAASEGLLKRSEQDDFARLVGKAVQRHLVEFEQTHAGVPAAGATWSDSDFQMRSGYFVTVAGRQMVDLFRRQRITADLIDEVPIADDKSELRDCFICHASEDKQVALLLAEAVISRGWTVWLDQLDLTLGDSLNGEIEAALTRSRFGVVVLSRAFFTKQWTRRELGALAAREISGERKVILPVWHGVDHEFIVTRSPVLADRLGVSTDLGMEKVATEISKAIGKAGLRDGGEVAKGQERDAGEIEDEGTELLSIPTSMEQRERLVSERADWWEYRLFAGRLMEGLLALEDKWQDHELRLPGGSRTTLGAGSVAEFISREMAWLGRQVATVKRILAPAILERAFGAPGEAGEPEQIEAAARRVVALYESLLDWAARIRNTDCGSEDEEVIELTAQMVDQPLREIREFIQTCADQIARFGILSEGGTDEQPIEIRLALRLTIDEQVQERVHAALNRAS
jgi:TIR domain